MNSHDISIMSINDGKSSLTTEQISANLALTKHLISTHHIPKENVVALGDWAVGRHIAPGPYFPWEEFAQKEMGRWPKDDSWKTGSEEVVVSYKNPKKAVTEELDHLQQLTAELSQKYITIAEAAIEKLGYVGKAREVEKDIEGCFGSATLSANLAFQLHYRGDKILGTPLLKKAYDETLWKDINDHGAIVDLAGDFTTFDLKLLGTLVDGSYE